MYKNIVYLLIFVVIAILVLFLINNLKITGYFIGFGNLSSDEWFNVTWHYRVKIEINSTVERTNWPVEVFLNFSDLIPHGTFDENSIRVFEYKNGKILYEVPHQYNKDENLLIFILNGTTLANQNRTFYIYYDILENGNKPSVTYSTNITYYLDSTNKTINVNVTNMAFYIDTNMLNNLSGIYRVYRTGSMGTLPADIILANSFDEPAEYVEYSNNTHTLTFDLRNKINITSTAPIRFTFFQEGDEVVKGTLEKTNKLKIIKKYHFYTIAGENTMGGFVIIEQNISNLLSSNINRSSTPSGALALDVNRTLFSNPDPTKTIENQSNPYSYVRVGDPFDNFLVGIINLNSSSNNFFAKDNLLNNERIGIHLNETTIEANSFIYQKSLVYFGAFPNPGTEFENVRRAASNPLLISIGLPEQRYVVIDAKTNATIYNRNETILIKVNITEDILNLTKYVNATFDMGTLSKDDDETIILYDDGLHDDNLANDKVFGNWFYLSNDSSVGIWEINITVYNNYSEYINSTSIIFNVTDILNVNVTVLNKNPIEGSLVKSLINVKNYRNDSFIIGANISCSVESQIITNFIDYLNGSYEVNFTAPPIGEHVLTCNATKNGNFGSNQDNFTSQAAKTNISISLIPTEITIQNITLRNSENFTFSTNLTNFGNGTAYLTNLTIKIPANWLINSSFENCNDIAPKDFCLRSFLVTVPNNTKPGIYKINLTANWTNPDGSFGNNSTSLNVNVTENPLIDVFENNISNIVKDGFNNYIGNFTVLSIGNYKLINISFNCFEGVVCNNFIVNFTPSNISEIIEGNNVSVAVNVTVPPNYQAGTYYGKVNVTAANDKFDLLNISVTIQGKTNFTIEKNPENYIATNVTFFNGESFILNVTTKNIGNSSGRFVNITLELLPNITSNSTLEQCNDLKSGESCGKIFNITILNKTRPEIYKINITIKWLNLDDSLSQNKSEFIINVTENPLIDVLEDNISNNATAGINNYIGNFTVLSIGNYKLINISFNCFEGVVCNNFIVNFTPSNISEIIEGNNVSVAVNVTVPPNYQAGTYYGKVNVTAANDKFDLLNISVTIIESRVWNIEPNECIRATDPQIGIACEVKVINLGNTYINFTIYPEEGNYTKVNVTNFTVEYNQNYTFAVQYNVTSAPEGFYNSTFIIDAIEENAIPNYTTLLVGLVPATPPIIIINLSKNDTFQKDPIEIFSNVTDISGAGIKYVRVNVTLPNSTTLTYNMTNLYDKIWYLKFNETELVGNYTVKVFAEDNIGNFKDNSTFFIIKKFLNITLSTFSAKYFQGDSASIYYKVLDINSNAVKNVNVSFKVFNPNNSLIYFSFYSTNEEGTISPLPTFGIASDAIIGNYTLQSISSYIDNSSGIPTLTLIEKNYSFQVTSKIVTVAGMFVDISTSIVWYPDSIMKVGILVYDGEGKPLDPDELNLTVINSLDQTFFSVNKTNLTREFKGFYTYRTYIPLTAPTGMYLAFVNASKGELNTIKLHAFRVARGGPYDLRVLPLESEVEQGRYLNFQISIINFGEVNQDVYLEYWVSDLVGTRKFFQASEFVFTPALQNISLLRQALIFGDQPPGDYLINVKMIFDVSQPELIVNASFRVKARELIGAPPAYNISQPVIEFNITSQAVTIPVPIPKMTANLTSKILIEKYNKNISVAKGYIKVEIVSVKNIGELPLNNVSLDLIGIPMEWINITPSNYALEPNQTATFIITFTVPKNAREGIYKATLIASSNLVSDSKDVEIVVFKSLKELIEEELAKLEDELAELVFNTKIAEKEGKDVSVVKDLIKEIRTQIDSARSNLRFEKYEEALKNLEQAKILLERAKDLLSKLSLPVKAFVLPVWLIITISSTLTGITVAILIFRKLKKERRIAYPSLFPLIKAIESMRKKVDVEKLEEEKRKILTSLKVLERSREAGEISISSYEAIKKSLEEKLKKIEKELKST